MSLTCAPPLSASSGRNKSKNTLWIADRQVFYRRLPCLYQGFKWLFIHHNPPCATRGCGLGAFGVTAFHHELSFEVPSRILEPHLQLMPCQDHISCMWRVQVDVLHSMDFQWVWDSMSNDMIHVDRHDVTRNIKKSSHKTLLIPAAWLWVFVASFKAIHAAPVFGPFTFTSRSCRKP